MLDAPLRFGIFLAPFHPIDENPALALERDFQLVEHLDGLGYDEAWIGEHHSAGYETIASPEVFIAAAGERTRRIRLGTGVSSLPYHHPFILADRVQQLDYQLKGRFMFGVGPGSLPSDAFMMGIDPLRQRDMMEEALDVIIPLLRGEAVTKITDWFSVKEARLQLMPYTRPHVEMAVAAQISPAGPRAAGKHGIGMLSIGSTTSQGYMALSAAWGICEELAREHKQAVSRHHWRLVAPMHVAETREKALENVRFGLGQWVRYFTEVIALPFEIKGSSIEDKCAQLIESGYAVIGDPDDAAAQLERLDKQSGGFGCFLQLAHNWADFPQTLRSYELIARYVMPRFQGLNPGRQASLDWTATNREKFMNAGRQAKVLATEKHLAERRGKPSA
ncbi:MAG: LLM class flavin-dependent oxidoreductase [Candidatus Rokuibacteriota bacterium]|nr:MAG: LLM class flavin-dependent oxidoreductase [Candidatus Rokubacteria bacterium]